MTILIQTNINILGRVSEYAGVRVLSDPQVNSLVIFVPSKVQWEHAILNKL